MMWLAVIVHHPDHNLWWQIEHYTGTGNPSGFWYLLHSGVLGGLLAPPILAAVALAYWHHSCHEPRCIRWGRHQSTTDLGHHTRSCRRHHPDPLIREGVHSLHHIHRHHRDTPSPVCPCVEAVEAVGGQVKRLDETLGDGQARILEALHFPEPEENPDPAPPPTAAAAPMSAFQMLAQRAQAAANLARGNT